MTDLAPPGPVMCPKCAWRDYAYTSKHMASIQKLNGPGRHRQGRDNGKSMCEGMPVLVTEDQIDSIRKSLGLRSLNRDHYVL